MIGMNQIKKRLINGILIGLGIGLVCVIITIIIANNIVTGYKEGTNKTFLERYTADVVTFTRDVVQGETITPDMLQTTTIHINTVPSGAYTSTGAVVGQIAKYNIVRNSAAVASMVSDKIISQDMRIQEINAVKLPTDLMVNDFIDIRLMYPSGVEYIVLAQKQVTKIVGNTIWMDMTEEDTLILNSAIVDSYLTDGTKLYAVRYTDPTTQIKLDGEEQAMNQAKLYLKDEIGKELAKFNSFSDIYGVEDRQTGNLNVYGEPETQAVMTASDEILDIITRYAIEYRYYVESYNKIETNYQPNAQVMAYMKENKYVVDAAKDKLDEAIRQGIETSIALFENSNVEGYESVVSGINNSVSAQQALREQVLGSQGFEE